MGGSIFGSSADQSTKAVNVNKSVTVSDQGLNFAPGQYQTGGIKGGVHGSGNVRNVFKLGKGSTYTSGLTDAQINGLLDNRDKSVSDSISAQIAAALSSQGAAQGPGIDESIQSAVADRIQASDERAVDEIKTGSPSTVKQWLLWGAGAVVAALFIGLLIKFFVKKKH